MYAKLNIRVGMNDLILYNERKVAGGKANCIYAGNFLKDAEDLSKADKQDRFRQLWQINQESPRWPVSAVLQFSPVDKLPQDDLIDIGRDFMHRIGYGQQPYLMYSHNDTAQQHLHIVSTNIRQDGTRIDERYMRSRFVRPAEKEIHERYGLSQIVSSKPQTHDPREKIEYGKTATTQAMSDTLQYIMDNYCYRSLPEFNAILRLYNLRAYDGRPGSKLQQFRGLIYQVLDDSGKPRNAPVKASAIPSKPTLKNLEPRFAGNLASISADVDNIRLALERALNAHPATPDQFDRELRRNRLAAVPTFDTQGLLKDLFFVDLAAKAVRTATELGDNYLPATLKDRLGFDPFIKPERSRTRRPSPTREPEIRLQHTKPGRSRRL